MKSLTAALLLLVTLPALGAPAPLELDPSVKMQSFERYIRAVHEPIAANGKSVNTLRAAILDGMLDTKGFAWVYDGEDEGYLVARFDYRGEVARLKIEYNSELVQIKYLDGTGDMRCKNNLDGICYKADRDYYNYIKNLRKSIAQNLKKA